MGCILTRPSPTYERGILHECTVSEHCTIIVMIILRYLGACSSTEEHFLVFSWCSPGEVHDALSSELSFKRRGMWWNRQVLTITKNRSLNMSSICLSTSHPRKWLQVILENPTDARCRSRSQTFARIVSKVPRTRAYPLSFYKVWFQNTSSTCSKFIGCYSRSLLMLFVADLFRHIRFD